MAFEMLTVFRADLSDLDSKAALAKTITQQTAKSMTSSLENVGQGFKTLSTGMDSIATAASRESQALKSAAMSAQTAGTATKDLALQKAGLLAQLNNVSKGISSETKVLADLQSAQQQYGTGQKAINAALSDSEKKLASYLAQQSLLKGELKSVEAALHPVATALVPTASGFAKLSEEVKHLATGMVEVPPGAHGIIAALGGMTIAGTGAALVLAGIGVAAIEAGQEINAAWRILEVKTGEVGAGLDSLKADFAAVFVNVPSSAKEVADAIAEIHIRTGETGAALQELATKEIELAHITGAQLGPQIEATSKLFAQWGPQIKSPSEALDTLFKISQKTGITVTQLATELNKAGPVMTRFGIGFTQGAAMIAQLDKEGLDSQKIIAGMSIAFRKLVDSLHGDVLGAFDALVKKMRDAKTEAEANTLAMQFFGRGAATMGEAVRSGKLDVEGLTESLKNAGPGIEELAEKTRTIGESFEIFKNKVTAILAPLGQDLIVALKGALGSITDFMHDNQTEIKTGLDGITALFKDWGPVLGNVVAAAGDVLTLQWGKALERLAIATATTLENAVRTFRQRMDEMAGEAAAKRITADLLSYQNRNKPDGSRPLAQILHPLQFDAPLLKTKTVNDIVDFGAFFAAGTQAGEKVAEGVKRGSVTIPGHLKKHGTDGAKAFVDGFTEGASGLSKAVELVAGQSTAQLEHLMDPLTKGAKKNLAETQAALKAETTGINEYLSSVGITAKLSEAQLAGMSKSTRDELGASAVAWKNNQEVVGQWAIELLRATGVTLPQVNEYLKSIGATTDISGKQLMEFSQTNTTLFNTIISGTRTFENHKKAVTDLTAGYELQWAAIDRLHPPMTAFIADVNIATESEKQVETASAGWIATLDKLPPSLLSVAQASVKAAKDGQSEWVANTQTFFEYGKQLGYTGEVLNKFTHDSIAGLKDFGAVGERAFSDLMKAQAQVSFVELQRKVNSAVNGIVEIFTLIPGSFGKLANEIQKTVNTIDKILGNLNKIFSSIPANLGGVIAQVIGLFKNMGSQVTASVDSIGGSLDAMQKTAKNAAQGIDLGQTADNWVGDLEKIDQASGAWSESVGGQMDGVVKIIQGSAAKGLQAIGAMVGGIGLMLSGHAVGGALGAIEGALGGALTGAMIGGYWAFATGGLSVIIGAAIGGIVGLVGGLLGGQQNALQKAQAAAQLQQAKDAITQSQQSAIQAVETTKQSMLDTASKIHDILESIRFYTAIPHAAFAAFFHDLAKVMQQFSEMAQAWSADAGGRIATLSVDMKAATEAIANAPSALNDIGKYLGIPEASITRFFVDLGILLNKFDELASTFTKATLKHAAKFAELMKPAVDLMATTVTSITGIFDVKAIPAANFDILQNALKEIVTRIGQVADYFDKAVLKAIGFFASTIGPAIDLWKNTIDAIKSMVDIPTITADDANKVVTQLRMFLDALIAGLGDMQTDQLVRITAIAASITPIAGALKAWADATAAIRGYTAIAAETWQLVIDDFQKGIQLMGVLLDQAVQFEDMAISIETHLKSGAQHLADGIAAMANAVTTTATALGAAFGHIQGGEGSGGVFPGGGDVGGASFGGGGFAPSFASGGFGGLTPSFASSGGGGNVYFERGAIQINGSLIHQDEVEDVVMRAVVKSQRRGKLQR